MQRDTGLRNPFAADDDDNLSGSSAGRPPPGVLRPGQGAPLRSVAEPSTSALFNPRVAQPPPSGPSPYTGSLGAPRAIGSSARSEGTALGSATRSLGLSLGVPRIRMATNRGTGVGSAEGEISQAPGAVKRADEAVRNTDSDALISRLSALKLGYLPSEPFTQEFSYSASTSSEQGGSRPGFGGPGFARPHQPDTQARRSPVINIGTYLRCSTIDQEVESFLKAGSAKKQIISIGAGSDSRYWRIMSNAELAEHLHTYVEVDFAENTNHKLSRILKSATLRSHLDTDTTVHGLPISDLSPASVDEERLASLAKRSEVLRSSKYTLLAADVRNLHSDTPEADRIHTDELFGETSTGLASELPTLVLFECVLAYVAPEKADLLIRLLGERFADVQALSYDIALAGDYASPGIGREQGETAIPPSRFGKVMLQNLEMRNLSLPGAKAYPTIKAQSQRFADAWSPTKSRTDSGVAASGRSLFSIWSALDAEQKQRLSRLEGLDEVEEIDMLLKHYCIVQARRKP